MPSTNSHFFRLYDQIKRNIRELYPETTITNLGGTRTNQSTPTGFSEDYILVVLQYTGTGRPTISFFVLVQTVHLIHVIRLFSELYSVTSGWIAIPAYDCSWRIICTQRYPQHRLCMISNGYIIGNLFKWANIFSNENLKNCSLSIY